MGYSHNGYGYPNDGSGVYLKNSISSALVRSNTISGNAPYGIYVYYGLAPYLVNDIIRQNSTNIFSVRGLEDVEVSYCCIEGGFAGTGNIDCDPCFVDSDANNFHLKPVSLCIDAGDPCAYYGEETDIDGEPRITNGRADIGGDEVTKADYNGDLIVNFLDYALLYDEWLEPNSNKSLDNDTDVDTDDLVIFCNDWLWTSGWTENIGMLLTQPGSGDMGMDAQIAESFSDESISQYSQEVMTDAVPEELPKSVDGPFDIAQDGPMSNEHIEKMIDWTQQLWQTSPEIQDMIEPKDLQQIIDSLEEKLND